MSLQTWIEELKASNDQFIAIRRTLHENPEPSFEEVNTSALIIETLKSFGITDIKTNVGNGYGLVATVTGAKPGKMIALRADFDALRIPEESDVSFKSKNSGIMHACGHDAHTAALLGVAKVVANHKDELTGSVRFLFQNAEEVLPGGAKSMVEAGALEGVDVVYGIHISSALPAGRLGYCETFGSAASDTFKMTVQGRGGHAANPHLCVDSVIIAAQIITQLQTIVSRTVNPIQPAVVTFGGVDAGATAANIIADKADIVGTIRTLDPDVRALVKQTFLDRCQAIATMNGGSVNIDYTDGYPPIVNTANEISVLKEVLDKAFGEDAVDCVPVGMGGEDFAYYLQEKPGAFFYVGARNEDTGAVYPHHHPKFKIDEQCILQSGEAFLNLIATYLTAGGI